MNNFFDRNRNLIRSIFRLFVIIVILIYFPLTMSYVNAEKRQIVCQEIYSRVRNKSDNILITDKGLESIIRETFPALEGTPVVEMNLWEMEREIEKSPVVKRCEMYPTVGGVLHVEIEQREPIMRVFTSNSSYYMDETSFHIIARQDMRANCVVVNGNVGAIFDFKNLIELCKFINENNFWRAQIEQIYVTDRLEFILIPRVGDHIVEFGGIDRMEEKFENLYELYTHGWEKHEWNTYKKVNLKYNGQIICTKK